MTAPLNWVPNRAVVTRAVSLLTMRASAADFVYAVESVGALTAAVPVVTVVLATVVAGDAVAVGATSVVAATAATTAEEVRRERARVVMPSPW
jgi:hypothetical protein